MRKGISGWSRRFAAVLAVSVVTLFVTGTGAGAVTVPQIVNYVADGSAQVLDVSLDLGALNGVVDTIGGVAGIKSPITQRISFSNAFGQVDKLGDKGTGLGQLTDGTLNPLLETVSNTVLKKALPRVFATLGEVAKHADLAALDLGGLVKIGVSDVNAVSGMKSIADGLRVIESKSDSKLLGVSVDLGAGLTDTLKGILKPVLDLTDAPGGLVDTLNGILNTVDTTLDPLLAPIVDLDLTLPKVEQLLSQPLLTVGLIQTGSETSYSGPARIAKGLSRMVDIDVFGKGANALVHIDSLSTETFAQIGGSNPVATAINRVAGLKILNNNIDLTNGILTVNNKPLQLPLNLMDTLNKLVVDTLGLEIDVLGTNTFKAPNGLEASAEANTIKIGLAPLGLFKLGIKGPGSKAYVAGSGVNPVSFPNPGGRTGVADTTYLLAGPLLIGVAILVRRFALSH
jgi:hypothetical protein